MDECAAPAVDHVATLMSAATPRKVASPPPAAKRPITVNTPAHTA